MKWDSAKINGVLVIVGSEILTHEGDILTFGLKDMPNKMVSAKELLTLVKKHGGAAVAAHPFRNNNRGMGENMRKVSHLLTGIESFNAVPFTPQSTILYLSHRIKYSIPRCQ